MKPEQQSFLSFMANLSMAVIMIILLIFLMLMIIGIFAMVTSDKCSLETKSKGSYSDQPSAAM